MHLDRVLAVFLCMSVVLISNLSPELLALQEGNAETSRTRNMQSPAMEPNNGDVSRTQNMQSQQLEPNNADVSRTGNLQSQTLTPNNADVSRTGNLQSDQLEPNNADVSRTRNFQSLELAPPPTYRLTVKTVNSSDLPVSGALIAATNVANSSDFSGVAFLDVPCGTYNVTASHPDYAPTSWPVDLDNDRNITLILPSLYIFEGEIPDLNIIVNPTEDGYSISLLDVFTSSSCDVFFDWNSMGPLLNGTVFQDFTYPQLPNLIIEAAQKGSPDYPKARFKYLVPIALTPMTGNEGAFMEEPVPYAAASIYVIPDPPIAGKPTILGVFLHNTFNQSLHVSRIDFQVSGLAIGVSRFTSVGYLSDITLLPGVSSSYNITWIADVNGHHCVRVVLTYSPTTHQVQKNLDIETDVFPGTQTSLDKRSAPFAVQNPTEESQNLKLKIDTDCPPTWSIRLTVNGKSYDVSQGMAPITLSNFAPGELSASVEVQYPTGEGLSSHKIDIEGYVGDTLVGGIRKIVVPSEVIPIESIGTSFTPENDGWPFDNWDFVKIGGYCLGMSYVAWNRWHFGKPLPQNEIVAKGLIVGFQGLSLVSDVLKNVALQIANNVDRNALIKFEYETTYNKIANGQATLLVLTQKGGGSAHAVVAYKVQEVGYGVKYIYVYDPNFSPKTHSTTGTYGWTRKIVVRNEGPSWTMSYDGGGPTYDAFGVFPDTSLDELTCSLTIQGFSDYDLHLYDQFGNHTGYNYAANKTEQQITYSSYEGPESEPQVIAVFNPYNGTYTVRLVGKNDSAFHLAVQTFDLFSPDGLVNSEHWLNGMIAESQIIEYTVVVYRDEEGKLRADAGDVHEIGITEIESSKAVAGEGSHVSLNVTVQNYGSFTESFNLTFYLNGTEFQKTLVTLAGTGSTIITFDWDTSGFAKGNYALSAYAEPVPGETQIVDNSLTSGWVIVSIVGDVNGDCKVDMKDIGYVARRFMCIPDDPLWDPNADIDGNGKIDMKDIGTAARHFGEHL